MPLLPIDPASPPACLLQSAYAYDMTVWLGPVCQPRPGGYQAKATKATQTTAWTLVCVFCCRCPITNLLIRGRLRPFSGQIARSVGYGRGRRCWPGVRTLSRGVFCPRLRTPTDGFAQTAAATGVVGPTPTYPDADGVVPPELYVYIPIPLPSPRRKGPCGGDEGRLYWLLSHPIPPQWEFGSSCGPVPETLKNGFFFFGRRRRKWIRHVA